MSYRQRFERNLGFLSSTEQDILKNSSVAIAGAGGDGGMLAVQLARLGIGEIRLADPETFELENINRQAVCTNDTIGVNKAEAVGEYISRINPDAQIIIYDQGVTPSNTSQFLDGVHLLIDETEFTLPEIGVGLAREARRVNIPNLTALNIGFAGIVTTYRPSGPTLEARLGLSEEMGLEEIAETNIPLSRWLPYLPPYGDLKVLDKVSKDEIPAPSLAPGVALAAGLGATQATMNLLRGQNHRRSPVYAPSALIIDAITGVSKTVKYNRASHYRHLVPLLGRNLLKLNPQTNS